MKAIKSTLKEKKDKIKLEVLTLYLCYKDPQTPIIAKIVSCFVACYALSPIDLIPDFIPIIGYLDDLILIPLGVYIALKIIPKDVYLKNKEIARTKINSYHPKSKAAAVVIICIWIILLIIILMYVMDKFML